MTNRPCVLFFRDFRRMTGGHLKVRDYYDHLAQSGRYDARIHLTPASRPDHPWRSDAGLLAAYEPDKADILFIAGLDWRALQPFPEIERRKPVVNLVQGVRHAAPDDPRYRFLRRRAVRICVSEAVAAALRASGACNGPVHVVPLGIAAAELPDGATRPTADILVAGLKRPDIARALAERLGRHGLRVDCLTDQVERAQFLQRIAAARIAVTLPSAEEGFFMPALEAMRIGRPVVCPDCVGNREFCIDRVTALMPPCEAGALEDAVLALLDDPALQRDMVAAATRTARRYTLEGERDAFLDIMDAIG